MNKIQKSTLIGVSAIVLSTLGIQASDIVNGIQTNFSGMVIGSDGPCGSGSTEVLFGQYALCVDMYEASASKACPNPEPENQLQTQDNVYESDCKPVSQENVLPWRYVSLTQAQQLCARSGKRLPTNEEWYKIAGGISDESTCTTDNGSSPAKTGTDGCITSSGVYDMIGNVWEWVDEQVVGGIYDNRQLPETGFVALVDKNGVVLETSSYENKEFGNDYAWTNADGVFGIIRGGFYSSGDDAGIFAQNMSVPLNFKTAGVGFRCVKDI